MLDTAQEIVGRRKFVARAGVDPAFGSKNVEHGDGAAAAKLGVPSAGNELLGLHEKLDLANASTAEFDVVAFDRDLAMPAIGVDLLLHFVDVRDRCVVEIFAPDEGRQIAQEPFPGNQIAGADASL